MFPPNTNKKPGYLGVKPRRAKTSAVEDLGIIKKAGSCFQDRYGYRWIFRKTRRNSQPCRLYKVRRQRDCHEHSGLDLHQRQ